MIASILYNDKVNQINEIIESIKTFCLLNDRTKMEFSKRENTKKGIVRFIIESKNTSTWSVIRNKFDQESNGYASIRFIFDIKCNRVYVRTKFKSKIITINKPHLTQIGNIEVVDSTSDIEQAYKRIKVLYAKNYSKNRYSNLSDVEHFYEHVFKLHKLDVGKLILITSVFLDLRFRHL